MDDIGVRRHVDIVYWINARAVRSRVDHLFGCGWYKMCDLAQRERVGDIEYPRTGRSPLLPLRAVQAKQALFLAINFPPLPGIRYCGRGSRGGRFVGPEGQ